MIKKKKRGKIIDTIEGNSEIGDRNISQPQGHHSSEILHMKSDIGCQRKSDNSGDISIVMIRVTIMIATSAIRHKNIIIMAVIRAKIVTTIVTEMALITKPASEEIATIAISTLKKSRIPSKGHEELIMKIFKA
jgi:hypothetical protein